MNKIIKWFNPPVDNQGSLIILRIMAGGIFLEGSIKFIFADRARVAYRIACVSFGRLNKTAVIATFL